MREGQDEGTWAGLCETTAPRLTCLWGSPRSSSKWDLSSRTGGDPGPQTPRKEGQGPRLHPGYTATAPALTPTQGARLCPQGDPAIPRTPATIGVLALPCSNSGRRLEAKGWEGHVGWWPVWQDLAGFLSDTCCPSQAGCLEHPRQLPRHQVLDSGSCPLAAGYAWTVPTLPL